MFELLRKRFGVPGIISVIALVLAMTGGAWAASKYVITSTKQIKPSVLAALKGNTGPAGANGASGANGTNGAPGGPGANGTSVTNTHLNAGNPNCPEGGAEFKVGTGTATFACNGEEGGEGPEGSPWVVGSVPAGSEMRGTWAVNSNAAAPENIYTAISTGVPLGAQLTTVATPGPGSFPFECPGTAAAPLPANNAITSEPFNGVVCLYTGESTNLEPEAALAKLTGSGGGLVVKLSAEAAGPVFGYGSWAMLAP